MRQVALALLLAVALVYVFIVDFNGFSSNWEDWVIGFEAFQMKLGGIF